MDTDGGGSTLGLLYYFRVLRRRWYAVPLGGLLGLGAAFGFLVITPSTSTAFTAIDLNVVSSDPFNVQRPAPDLLNRTSEEQTARSPAVVELVADEIGRSVADIRAALTATVLPESTVIQLRYTGPSRAEAAEGADALATAYLQVRSEANAERVERILAEYDRHLQDLRDRLATATIGVAQASGPERAAARADQDVIRSEIDIVLQERSGMAGIDTNGGSVIASASDNQVEVSPNRNLILATGLLGGLVVGVIAAFTIDSSDRRIRDRADVEDAGCGPVLSFVRGKSSATPSSGDDLDAVRSVREHLLADIPDDRAVLSVVEVASQEAPTDVAVNLAVEMASAGLAIELVLAEYPRATIDRIEWALELHQRRNVSPDVSTYASGTYADLRVHVPGATHDTANPSTAFVARLRSLAKAGELAPMTIIALPPRASRSLTLAAGRLGTSVVTVCIAGNTRRRALSEVADELASVKALIHGTVLLSHRRPWSTGHVSSRRERRAARHEVAKAEEVAT